MWLLAEMIAEGSRLQRRCGLMSWTESGIVEMHELMG